MRRSGLVAAAVAVIAAGVAAAVLLLGPDDDSRGVATADWADSVCSSLADWRSSIVSLADVSGQTLTPELLQEKLGDASAATDGLVTELVELGPPDVAAGEDVEQALDDVAEGLRSSYLELERAAADAVGARSQPDFLRGLAALAPRFQSLLDQVGETAPALRSASLFGESSAELERAFAESDACRELEDEG